MKLAICFSFFIEVTSAAFFAAGKCSACFYLLKKLANFSNRPTHNVHLRTFRYSRERIIFFALIKLPIEVASFDLFHAEIHISKKKFFFAGDEDGNKKGIEFVVDRQTNKCPCCCLGEPD